jgi:hypothetical protein
MTACFIAIYRGGVFVVWRDEGVREKEEREPPGRLVPALG